MKVKVRITGRVQGVAYRAWTRATAVRLNLTGWVRNEADGAVLALISGPESKVATMIEALWKGPPAAIVDNVEVSDTETAKDMYDFRVIR